MADYKEVSASYSKDGINKTFRVEEVENGFIVTVDESGYKGEGEMKHHYYECRKYISKTNPLDKSDTKEVEGIDSISATIKNAISNLKL